MFNTEVSYQRLTSGSDLRFTRTFHRIFVAISCFCSVFLSLMPAMGAEDVTVTTYYPSPRGVYDELRTTGNVGIGTTGAIAGRLHVRGTPGTTNATNLLR